MNGCVLPATVSKPRNQRKGTAGNGAGTSFSYEDPERNYYVVIGLGGGPAISLRIRNKRAILYFTLVGDHNDTQIVHVSPL